MPCDAEIVLGARNANRLVIACTFTAPFASVVQATRRKETDADVEVR